MPSQPESGRRRRYTAEFKSQVVSACLEPGVSVAAIALAHQLNANLLRRWIKGRGDRTSAPAVARQKEAPAPGRSTTLVPIAVSASSNEIHIVAQRGSTSVRITWPVSQADMCARWLRAFLR